MKIMSPMESIPDLIELVAPADPAQQVDRVDEQTAALGRANATYEKIWQTVKEAKGLWVPVVCDNMRRAILVASSALQHRTQEHDVTRRGRVVCIRLKGGATNELQVA